MSLLKVITGAVCFATSVSAHAIDLSNGFEFSGYWRAGFNTAGNILQQPADAQGDIDAPTSRHIRNPSYFRVGFAKTFENKMKAEFSFDSPDLYPFPHQSNEWGKNGSFRTRDLYLQLPIGDESSIWAGSRRLEYEDIRLFDLQPLSIAAFGLGGTTPHATWALSFNDDPDITQGLSTFHLQRKTITAMLRSEIELDKSSSLKPMLYVTTRGKSDAQTQTTDGASETLEASKASTDVKAGVIYSISGEGYWSNNFLVVNVPAAQEGSTVVHNPVVTLATSSSLTLLDNLQALLALDIDLQSFKGSQAVYENKDDVLIKSESKTKSTATISVDVQPVYFVTDRFHVALDAGYVYHSKRINQKDANAFFATPILRYAFDKSALGTPQIYTSVTYGSYDAKVKKSGSGMSKTLVTTQTGFELWF